MNDAGTTALMGGCPCLYVEPCSSACTCANPTMSGGCSRCCRYGSPSQRRAAAEHLVKQELAAEREQAGVSGPYRSQQKRLMNQLGRPPEDTIRDQAARIATLEAVVRQIQWSTIRWGRTLDGQRISYLTCPMCGREEWQGHHDGCIVGQALHPPQQGTAEEAEAGS